MSTKLAADAIHAIDPQPIVDTATGFMRAKHLFVASEIGLFEVLARGPKSIDGACESERNAPVPKERILRF